MGNPAHALREDTFSVSFITYTTSKDATARAISLEHKAVCSHRRFLRLRKLEKVLYRLYMVRTAWRVCYHADAALDYAMHCAYMAQQYLRRGDIRCVVEHERHERLVECSAGL